MPALSYYEICSYPLWISCRFTDGGIVRRLDNLFALYELGRRLDNTSPQMDTVKIQFDMGGVCNGEIRQWSEVIVLPLAPPGDWRVTLMEKPPTYSHRIESLDGKVQGCRTEIIKARAGEPQPAPLDLRAETEAHKIKRESEEAAVAAARAAAVVAEAEAQAKIEEERNRKTRPMPRSKSA